MKRKIARIPVNKLGKLLLLGRNDLLPNLVKDKEFSSFQLV